MALSNWDTLAVNEKGKSITGAYTSPGGVTVEFYKNWLYVRDAKAWNKKSQFTKPTIMQVNSGDFTYKDVQIHAVRGPKGGVYALVYTSKYQEQSKEKDAKYIPPIITGMVGIGCYGFLSEVDLVLEKLGRKPQEGDMWCSGSLHGGGQEIKHFIENLRDGKITEKIEHAGYDLDELWVGVEQAEIEFLKKFLADEDNSAPDEFKNIDFSKTLRFNQGDKFLAENIGQETPTSAPGESSAPLIGAIIKGMK